MTKPLCSAVIIGSLGALMSVFAWADNDPPVESQLLKYCVNASLQGSYGFYRSGVTAAGPLAGIGILHFDGYNTTGTQSISRNGTIQFDAAILGTYQLNQDCTGKFIGPDGTEIARVVVVDNGNGFFILSETAGNSVYGVGRRIGTD